MNDGKQEETEDLEVCSEEDSPVSDDCMVEEVLRQSYQGYSGEADSCDWSSPDANQNKEEAEYEPEKTEDEELGDDDGESYKPVGGNQGN